MYSINTINVAEPGHQHENFDALFAYTLNTTLPTLWLNNNRRHLFVFALLTTLRLVLATFPRVTRPHKTRLYFPLVSINTSEE